MTTARPSWERGVVTVVAAGAWCGEAVMAVANMVESLLRKESRRGGGGERRVEDHHRTPGEVARVRDTYGIPAPRTAAVHEGEVSIAQAAAQLGVAPKAVGNWIRKGPLPARRGAAGRWWVPWDEATQQLYRQQVKRSFRVKRTTPTTAGGAV